MTQKVYEGFTCNIKGEPERHIRDCNELYGKYHHMEIVTYGKEHMYYTMILHYEPYAES